MKKLGIRQLIVFVKDKVTRIPSALAKYKLKLLENGESILYTYDKNANRTGITRVLSALSKNGIIVKDLQIHESSLEEVFLSLIKKDSQ